MLKVVAGGHIQLIQEKTVINVPKENSTIRRGKPLLVLVGVAHLDTIII